MKLANRGGADIKSTSYVRMQLFLVQKISLNAMFSCMRSLHKDLDFSMDIFKKTLFLVSLKVS